MRVLGALEAALAVVLQLLDRAQLAMRRAADGESGAGAAGLAAEGRAPGTAAAGLPAAASRAPGTASRGRHFDRRNWRCPMLLAAVDATSD